MPFVNVIQSTQYIHVIATCDICFFCVRTQNDAQMVDFS